MHKLIDYVCNLFIKNSPQFIGLIKVGYFALSLFVGIVLTSPYHARISNLFGEAAVVFYILTLIPGIAMRLGIHHSVFNLLRLYRRFIGIAMYLLVLSHVVLKKFPELIPDLSTTPTFELMGIVSLIIFLLLFLTSNNRSQKLLGIGWVYLHKLTYIGMFFILLHLSLQGSKNWGLLMWVTIVLELVSFYVASRRSLPVKIRHE
ncbi:ferric reductase-like transmembrane domain-containing protein [Candidatus Shapirobacteria bacterium]|nr:ferric reductase-like transmembrane domain-containing protein [Candidatus Shapirobacteria bacterium]